MIFRDGLRVLPYGRTDNDFFDIESRRSKSAGREFWNHRQMFGRIAITREHNPNLKVKAGREGLLDNRAAKTLKALIANILMQSARRYFGSASEIRRDLLPEISSENKRRRRRRGEEQATPTSEKAMSALNSGNTSDNCRLLSRNWNAALNHLISGPKLKLPKRSRCSNDLVSVCPTLDCRYSEEPRRPRGILC